MSLFIGLGGVGSGTLDYLYEKMDTYNKDLARQDRPTVNATYYYIDTESARYAQHPEEFLSSNKKFYQIGLYSPDSIKNSFRRGTLPIEIEQRELMGKWYDAPAKTTNMIAGADTIRQYSRLSFDREAQGIRTDLETLVAQVTRNQGRIYVITGSCGGTGSGIYMDVLYMISEIYERQQTPAASTDVRLIIAMPEGYVADGNLDVQYKKKKLNAFAALAELNAICKDKNSIPSLFNGCYIGPFKKTGVFQPFRFGYLFDSAGEKRDEVSQKLSDFLFELELAGDPSFGISTNGNYNGSFFDGLLTGTVDGNWNNTINMDYVQAFNAVGQYSIEKPDFLYRAYFSDRLLFDIFHNGLIGRKGATDERIVIDEADKFKRNTCDAEVKNTCDTIMDSIMSKSDFQNDREARIIYSVFSLSPNLQNATVKTIIEKRDLLRQTIKERVYRQCRDWLGMYDFTSVYEIVDELDRNAYRAVLETNRDFDDQQAEAWKKSLGGLFSKSIESEKALEQFEPLLHTWLTFEVDKALSSGVNVDVSVQNQGYLDRCKDFIEKAKQGFVLPKEQEHWDEAFIQKVSALKAKEDRSYIPDLNAIVDNHSRIIPAPDSAMVSVYEDSYVNLPVNADFSTGKSAPVKLHERIINEMKANASLMQEGIDMEVLFDPTPGKTNTLGNASKTAAFVEKYIATAKSQINILLLANRDFQALFADDILTRLQNLPTPERTKKCLDFVQYNKVQLKTMDMGPGAVTPYTYYILSSTSNGPLMQALGILDAAGQKSQNTDHTPANTFFGDKIVKLIVKNGYKIDDYRYFDEYKTYIRQKMIKGEPHNPFIDKRFLGETDKDGRYPCDVSEALKRIAEDEKAAAQAMSFSLDGCKDVQVYQYGLVLLYQYFKSLSDGGNIDSSLKDGIKLSGNIVEIHNLEYDDFIEEYSLGSVNTIDIPAIKDINNMLDLKGWIDFIMAKKSAINDEKSIHVAAYKYLTSVSIKIGDDLKAKIQAMRGSGNKPVYDFFTAYMDWYNED